MYIYISTQFHTRRCFAHVFFVPACMFNLQLTLDVYELVLLWLSNQSKMHRDLQQSPVFQRSQLKIVVLGSAKPFLQWLGPGHHHGRAASFPEHVRLA